MLREKKEFEEIAHTGGKVNFDVKIDAEGKLSFSVEWTHSRPTPSSLFGVYAIPQGVAVGDFSLGGTYIPPPLPDCYPVLISSDSTGLFGQQCPSCNGYWRSQGGKICPYCAYKAKNDYLFLTDAQRRYVKQYCYVLNDAIASMKVGRHVIDMDSVAEAAGKDCKKPSFFYAEERQQNLFKCMACGNVNDVLGRYAYCTSCGTRNALQEIEIDVQKIRDRINAGGPYEACIKETVAAFDSFAGQYAKELLARIPQTRNRRTRLERAHFHSLVPASEIFQNFFEIDILNGIRDRDVAFGKLMFHRRHVYEHKGGEADEKYIDDSGDNVRIKQALRETKESAHRCANLVLKFAANLHKGFHDIFPPLEEPIRRYEQTKS